MGFSDQAKYTNKLSAILSLILPQNGYGKANAFQSTSSLLGYTFMTESILKTCSCIDNGM
jgi:hypothetical protein